MTSPRMPTAFAHPAEEQFARLLDYYGIAWQYEPHVFELDHHTDGALKKAFVPDFYLPQSDTYIELTTMRQRQISRKHRKIRLLKERFPHIRLKLFGRKHLEQLWARFGLPLALADDESPCEAPCWAQKDPERPGNRCDQVFPATSGHPALA